MSERWLRAACRLYPTDFRRLLEDDLAARYREERRRREAAEGPLRARAWAARTLLGVAAGGLAERWRTRGRGPRSRNPDGGGGMGGTGWLGDVRVAARSLVRGSPGFTALAVGTLALGVGANTTVFSVVDGVLLRPLPFPESGELVQLHELSEGGGELAVTGATVADWRGRTRAFEHVVARSNPAYGGSATVLVADGAVRVPASRVGEGFFAMMGVDPARGRGFAAEDHRGDAPPVAVVSHAFWEQEMGAPSTLSDRTLGMGSATVEVVGVMPRGFDFPDGSRIWLPLPPDPNPSRTSHNWLVTARLRDGVTVEAARAELAAVTAALKAEHGSDMTAVSATVRPLREELYGSMSGPLRLLLGASAFVLLVACTNLAGTLLARGKGRVTELAVRRALGAGRARVVRLLLTENLLVALAGAAAGAALARPLLAAFLAVGPAALADRVQLDLRVLAFTLGVGLLTVLLFGLYPALASTRTGLAEALRRGGRGGSGGKRAGWDLLVGLEVALALVLLAGSAVLVRSFARILSVEPGFAAEGVLSAEVSFTSSRYPDDAALAGAQRQVLDAVRRVPGVRAAGLVNHVPLGGLQYSGGFDREDGASGPVGSVDYRIASTGYFEAMDIPVLEGRAFLPSDDAGAEDVAVVSRAAADRYWPDGSPVGRRIRNLRNDSWIYPDRWITIVGVVGDVRQQALTREAAPAVYVHHLQRPARARAPVLAVATAGDAGDAAVALRDAVRGVDPAIPVRVVPMERRLADSVTDRRFTLLVLGGFSLVALLLAAGGIYGVVSYAVARRTREMGIRLALGARPGDVVGMVVSGSVRAVVAGAVAGTAGALALGRLLSGMLYEVEPWDPPSLAGAAVLLVAVGVAAALVPGLRATRVDPVRAMRAE